MLEQPGDLKSFIKMLKIIQSGESAEDEMMTDENIDMELRSRSLEFTKQEEERLVVIIDRFCQSYLEDAKNINDFLNTMKDLRGG